MRIDEITEPNDAWRILKDSKIEFREEFSMISKLLELLIVQKTPSRNHYFKLIIESFERDVESFLSETFQIRQMQR